MSTLPPTDHVRMDKWLWAVRLFKSRSMAAEACTAGHVKIGGQPIKPARDVHPGEVLTITREGLIRTVKVIALLDRRVGAPRVRDYLEDLTPPEEYARARAERTAPVLQYPKGWGRPTKKQRRQMAGLLGWEPGASDGTPRP